MKIVFTNGCFDILHKGHIELLKNCRSLSQDGKVIVGLNSDNSIKRLKGSSRPINNQETRKMILESLRFVDEVILFEEDTPEILLSKIQPDILVKGGDYSTDEIIGKQYAKKVVIFPYVDGISTTKTIQKITTSSCNR
jgi:D-beta-D-heptose 7-phosphate kinase/D-beta-D-heptose 1-phosphate adenosyltransferase